MWTAKNRGRYDRGKLRYPSDLTDSEWKLVEPLIPPGKRGGGKRTVVMREVVNGLMYILSTGFLGALTLNLNCVFDIAVPLYSKNVLAVRSLVLIVPFAKSSSFK